ncbi:MAG: ferritin-like domain-containing protein [Burkholderiaceae bacterium]
MNSALPRSRSDLHDSAGQAARYSACQVNQQVDQLRSLAQIAWSEPNPSLKCEAVGRLGDALSALQGNVLADVTTPEAPAACDMTAIADAPLKPGRPQRPELVLAHKVPRRSAGSPAGLAALLHSIAHIEFNAINLALDAVWRFNAMPASFVADWVSVAQDEARHFQMLVHELQTLDTQYGDFTAHDGLWMMARRTADDLVARMALVPRVLEARGLDATPVIQRKLRSAGHDGAVAVLQVILDEEVRHVAIGNDWFSRLCLQSGFDPEQRFRELIKSFDAPLPKGPINHDARLAAGFSQAELAWLQQGHD